MKIGKHRLLHQFGMQRSDAINAVCADKREIGHAHAAFAAFVDQRNCGDRGVIEPRSLARGAQQFGVDRIDQLHMPRQQPFEQGQRPTLKRFGEQSVVGIAKGRARNVPRFVKAEFVLIDQQAHQFGDRHRRVCIVKLDRGLIGERPDIAVKLHVTPDNVLD